MLQVDCTLMMLIRDMHDDEARVREMLSVNFLTMGMSVFLCLIFDVPSFLLPPL